jgi:hypothetical protein
VAGVDADGGALKMLCCNSVDVTAPAAAAGLWKVPSSFAIVSDFVLAYWICCRGKTLVASRSYHALDLEAPTMSMPKKLKPCNARMA